MRCDYMNEFYYNYVSPTRPKLRRLGTIKCDMVETTPIVFGGKLYRFEYFRANSQNEANPTDIAHFQFVDVYTNRVTTPFAHNYHLGSAYADGDYMYVTGVKGQWGSDTLTMFRSKDLENWEEFTEITLPGYGLYNTGICKKDGVYTMLVETNVPFNFHHRFMRSTDLKNWTLLDEPQSFQKDRYAGGPAIYTFDDDPYYYVLYLEACPGPFYPTCIARSRDLIEWEYSPINPFLMFDEAEDKKIANPFLTPYEQARIARAVDINNSDVEICEFNGRTIMYYSWGSQRSVEFLAEACYDGPMKEFLQSFFDNNGNVRG